MLDLFAQADCASNPKTLRPHQQAAIDLIRKSLAQGRRRVVCQGPTGFGKTLVAAKIIESALAKSSRVIFTAPAVSLIDQTVAEFEAEGVRGIGVMQANHPRTNRWAPVQVASVQTLARRDIPEASLVIVDEAHIRAEVVDQLLTARPDLFAIGLSATPWRPGMGLLWQDLVIPTTTAELIEGGYLSRFTVYAPDVPDLTGVKIKVGEYAEGALERVMGDAKLMGHVVTNWMANGENRPTLCFAVNCRHAADLRDEFERHGVSAEYVDASTDTVQRKRISARFRDGQVRVICSVRTMTTGVDLPVSCIIDAAPTMSEMLHVQKIGRGLRVNPGTEDCVVFDHAGNTLRLGLVTDIHHDKLDTTPPGKPRPRPAATDKLPTACLGCGVLHTGRLCPGCGKERVKPAGVEVKDGALVVVGGRVPVVTKDDKQRFFSMALSLARSRGKTDHYAAGLYKGRFGCWPRSLDHTPAAPDTAFLNYERSRRIAWAKSKEAQRGAA